MRTLCIWLGVAVVALSTDSFSQQFNEQQAAIADYYISEDVAVFKTGGSSIIGRSVGAVPTTAKEMRDTYVSNEVAGDQRYYKKKLLVSGKIARINSGLGNRPYLTLQDGGDVSGAQASFKNPDIDQIGKLKKGADIQLVCFGGGVMLGTPILRDCEFAEEIADKEISRIHRDVALAQVNQGGEIGRYLWAMIQLVEKYLSANTKCGRDQALCGQEIRKVHESKSFRTAWDQIR